MDDRRGNMVPVSDEVVKSMLGDLKNDLYRQVNDLEENVKQEKGIESLFHVFQEGEIFEIKGSQFKVETILANGLRLKLLPEGFVANSGSIVSKANVVNNNG